MKKYKETWFRTCVSTENSGGGGGAGGAGVIHQGKVDFEEGKGKARGHLGSRRIQ
jgi:hypothetical protein